ncbi:MAG: hypothetical protein OHK0047_38090 [Leptolyngbyaceae cyanobacterium]
MEANPLLNVELPPELQQILQSAPHVAIASNVDQLVELAIRDAKNGFHEVAYDIPERGKVVEASVCRVRNGISANYGSASHWRSSRNAVPVPCSAATCST